MSNPKLPSSYTEANERLTEIIAIIEQQNPDVDELISLTEEAVGLINFCREKLLRTDERVSEVLEKLSPMEEKNPLTN